MENSSKKEFIYLASPYTHGDGTKFEDVVVQDTRYLLACQAACALLQNGHYVYAPIPHTVAIAKCGLPVGYKFWKEYDHEMLRRLDKLVVLMLDGWKESVGVQDEIAFMAELGKPIEYMEMKDVTRTI